MALPKISLNDGKHKLIVAEDGERVLTPEENKNYEMQHPNARREPMQANVYDGGGDVAGYEAAATGGDVGRDTQALNKKSHAPTAAGVAQMPGQQAPQFGTETTPLMDQFDKGGDVYGGSEAESLKSKSENIDQYNAGVAAEHPSTQMRTYEPSSADHMHSGDKYGMRSGEKRLDRVGNEVDPTTPQGMGTSEPKLPVPTALYDEGGDVDTEDEIMNRQELGHGTKMGRADNTRQQMAPQLDTEPAERPAPLAGGRMIDPNYHKGDSGMQMDNSPANPEDTIKDPQVPLRDTGEGKVVSVISEASTRPREIAAPRPTAMKQMPDIETPKGNGTTDVPVDQARNEASAETAGYPVQHAEPKVNPEHMAIVQKDKEEAMRSGDLVKLGMANINERMLKAGGLPDQPTPTAPTARENVVNQEEELKHKMLNAPTEQERFQAEKDLAEMKRRTPWGSEGSAHPGVLGKIGHAAASIGQGVLQGVAPYVLPAIPGSQANIAKQAAIGEQGVEQAQKTQLNTAETQLKEAQARTAGAKTPSEQVYMHATRGGPNGGPQINPDTGQPYTDAEALELSTGAGKAPLQQAMNYLQKQVNPETGKKFTPEEAFAKASFDASNAKMNERQKRVADYVHAHNMEDTPANRETARIALETADVNAKALASLPYAEQKTKFSNDLATARSLLVQQNADANQRGLKADELQNTENARFDKVMNQIQLAKDALEGSDTSQFAANIVPVIATLTTTSAEGVKRINKQELDRFLPADGNLYRWASAHVDKWLTGEIPPEYKSEVSSFLDRLGKSFNVEHSANTKSIDSTVRQGAQQPTQKPEGGVGAPEKSKPQTAPTAPPSGSTHTGVSSVDGKTYYLDANGKKMGEVIK